MNSHTDDNLNETSRTFSRNIEENFKITSRLSQQITNFKNKTQIITDKMNGLQFSTTNLREKFTQDYTNGNDPIITQITAVNKI